MLPRLPRGVGDVRKFFARNGSCEVESSAVLTDRGQQARLAQALRLGNGHVVVTAAGAEAADEFLSAVLGNLDVYCAVRLSAAGLAPGSLVEALIEARGLGRDSVSFALKRRRAAQLVEDARAAGRPIVVIVDDAGDATAEELAGLHLALEEAREALDVVRVVLLGSRRLLETLERSELRALASRVAARVSHYTDPRGLARLGNVKRSMTASSALGCVAVGAGALLVLVVPLLSHGAEGVAAALVPTSAYSCIPSVSRSCPVVVALEEQTLQGTAQFGAKRATTGQPLTTVTPAQTRSTSLAALRDRVRKPSRATAGSSETVPMILQVGSFGSRDNAWRLETTLAREFRSVYVTQSRRGGRQLFRVRIGSFSTLGELESVEALLRAKGHKPLRIRISSPDAGLTPVHSAR